MSSPLGDTIRHPYYPREAEIVGYVPNDYSVTQLLAIFAAEGAALLLSTSAVAKKLNTELRRWEVLVVMWFVLSGSIHVFFEGYFVHNNKALGASQSVFGQLWKEYALSDSRYLTRDTLVLCMEAITVYLWGPLCFLVAYLTTQASPLRHPVQIIVSLGQLYGDVLYYATSLFDYYTYSISYSRPEAYYFWGYYFLMNFIWIVIPGYLIYESVEAIAQMVGAFERMEKTLKANGLGMPRIEDGKREREKVL